MLKTRSEIRRNEPHADASLWINIYQVWNAASEFVTKATFDEIAAEGRYDAPCYGFMFSLLHETRA